MSKTVLSTSFVQGPPDWPCLGIQASSFQHRGQGGGAGIQILGSLRREPANLGAGEAWKLPGGGGTWRLR